VLALANRLKEPVSLKPKVSLIIPVYNGADYLRDAIRSAMAQTYENIEIIVVDDGSRDSGATESIAREFADSIRFMQRENGGVAAALNTAIDAMTGDYFSWLSHDDVYATDKVEQEMEAMLRLDAGKGQTVIYSDYAVFSGSPASAIDVRMQGVPPEAFRYWLTIANVLHGCTLLIPRRAFLEVARFDESLRTTQDFDLWFRLAAHLRFRHLPKVLVYARSHAQQGSVKMADTAYKEGNALFIRFLNGLTPEDLRAGGEPSNFSAYAAIARSFWRRGFVQAARAASRTAIAARKDVAACHQILPMLTLIRGPLEMFFWKTLRRVLSPHIRATIRAALKATKKKGGAEEATGLRQRFSWIYPGNIIGRHVFRSRKGSDPLQTEIIRREIPALLRKLEAQSLLDAPCGDWQWMQKADLGIAHYIGVDIVDELVALNRQRFGNEHIQFECLDLTTDELPRADVILSRDCLIHLSYAEAMRVISNFKRSGARYLLTTTFTDRVGNSELTGKHVFWRPLNMQRAPFGFPVPVMLINEGCTENRGKYKDKCLGLWNLADIDVSQFKS
jgi:glycosyltransferase involved in cell wall biosynthesis/SAM-dependent methyltransferase